MSGVSAGIVIWTSLWALSLTGARTVDDGAQQQRVFNLEAEIQHPTQLPADILSYLGEDADAKRCKKSDTDGEAFRKWFSGGRIDLRSGSTSDFLVKAENGCLWGTSVGPFWVFHKIGDRYEMVLKAQGSGVEFLDARTRGLRDIRVWSHSAKELYSVICKYDGHIYRQVSRKTRKIRT